MDIFYCEKAKINYFMLHYFHSFSGHLFIHKHEEKAREIAEKYKLDYKTMYVTEIQKSSRYKYMIVMYSNAENQSPIEGAFVSKNAWEGFHR